MGSFGADFGKIAAEWVEKTGSKVLGSIAEKIPVTAYRALYDPARAFEVNPVAKALYNDHKMLYEPKVSQYESMLAKGVQNPAQAPSKIAPHVHTLISTGKQTDTGEMTKIASKMASYEIYGPKRVRIQSMLDHTRKVNSQQQADILSDHYNIMFQEAIPKHGGLSKFGLDMEKPSQKLEKGIKTPASPYKIHSPGEKGLGVFRRTLAHGAAAVHAATAALNITQEAGYKNTYKAVGQLFGPDHEIDNLLASNAISEFFINPLREKNAFDAGVIHKFAPGSVGAWIHANMYIPGLSTVRWHSVALAAQTGKIMAEEAALRLSKGDTKYAIPALERLGLEPKKIVSQGFKLQSEDIDKAYYHGANNKVFLHPYDATPTLWRQSPLFRGMKAFSGYVTKQAQFNRRILLQQLKQGDYLGISRSIANLGIVAPLAGASIYEFDRLRNGEDWDHPIEHYMNRIEATPAGLLTDKAFGKDAPNAAKTTFNTIHMWSVLGAFGSVTGYIRGANRASLLERFAPPEARLVSQGIQDIVKTGRTDDTHPDAYKPLERTMLSDIPSLGAGTIASHMLIPTRKEEFAGKAHKPRRSKNPKEITWNPAKYNPDVEF